MAASACEGLTGLGPRVDVLPDSCVAWAGAKAPCNWLCRRTPNQCGGCLFLLLSPCHGDLLGSRTVFAFSPLQLFKKNMGTLCLWLMQGR